VPAPYPLFRAGVETMRYEASFSRFDASTATFPSRITTLLGADNVWRPMERWARLQAKTPDQIRSTLIACTPHPLIGFVHVLLALGCPLMTLWQTTKRGSATVLVPTELRPGIQCGQVFVRACTGTAPTAFLESLGVVQLPTAVSVPRLFGLLTRKAGRSHEAALRYFVHV